MYNNLELNYLLIDDMVVVIVIYKSLWHYVFYGFFPAYMCSLTTVSKSQPVSPDPSKGNFDTLPILSAFCRDSYLIFYTFPGPTL